MRLPSHFKSSFALARPRLQVFDHFLSDLECAELIEKAKGKLRPSQVVDRVSGQSIDHEIRTSEGAVFSPRDDELLEPILILLI